jgi:hypothetical protein
MSKWLSYSGLITDIGKPGKSTSELRLCNIMCILAPATALVMRLSQNHSHCVSDMGVVEKGATRLVQESRCVRLAAKRRKV